MTDFEKDTGYKKTTGELEIENKQAQKQLCESFSELLRRGAITKKDIDRQIKSLKQEAYDGINYSL